jgi:hypothetical protein
VEGRKGRGGSSFVIVASGQATHACSYKDGFNGRYDVRCPLEQKHCTSINATLTYINFMAFYDTRHLFKIFPLFQTLWRQRFCYGVGVERGENNNMNVIPECPLFGSTPPKTIGDQPDYGAWQVVNQTLKWVSQGCFLGPFPSKQTSCRCVQSKYNNIYAVGSSHMRNIAYYLIEQCRELPFGKGNVMKHSSFTVENINFIWVDYVVNLTKLFRNMSADSMGDHSNDVILFQTGAWDLTLGNPVSFAKQELDEIISAVDAFLKSNSSWRNARLVWYNIIAFPDRNIKATISTNNNVIAALNWKLTESFKKLGVEVMDTFSMTFMRSTDNVCFNHYYCRNANNTMIGEAGKPIIMNTLKMLCN